jgi:hypothetical protein
LHFYLFESIAKKPFECIKSIGNYLETYLTNAQINQIVEFTSFDVFKDKEEKKIIEHGTNQFDNGIVFFRKGEIGDWQNYFTKDQAMRVDKVVERNLKYKRHFITMDDKNKRSNLF